RSTSSPAMTRSSPMHRNERDRSPRNDRGRSSSPYTSGSCGRRPTMPSVAFGVVAHQARRDAALALADPLGAYVSLDDGTLGAEANHLRVWEVLADASAEWVCVLEDDAVPSPNFLAQITAALTVAPSPVVSLYLGRSRPPGVQSRIQGAIRRLDAEGACWITADRMLHAVG